MARRFEYDNAPIIQTKYGKLRGYILDGIHIFKGIPYAQAKRFGAPQPPKMWDGVVERASYGMVSPMLTRDDPQGELLVPHRYWPQDENCMNLNIWTPTVEKDAKLPVMVWFHGGGFSMGSSIEQKIYNGENMARFGPAVVVTVNHRLNILGYLDLSPYGEKYANSGNRGQEDLVASLKWVRDNIAAFGGDPENVTIFGQSGGGGKVSGLLQTPAADGLFHRAVIMSGVSGLHDTGAADSRPLIRAMLKELALTEQEVEKLETLPYHDLAAAYNKVSPALKKQGCYVGCDPLRNDWYLGEGQNVGFTDHARTIPVMVGTVFGEFSMMPLPFNKQTVGEKELDAALTARFGEYTQGLKEEFAAAYPGKNPGDLLNLDTLFRLPTKEFIQAFARQGGKAYPYMFALEFPYQNGKIAWHCSDLPFFFHNTELAPVANIEGVSDALEEAMFGALMRFARTGDPGVPGWVPAQPGKTQTMVWDEKSQVRQNLDDKLLQLYCTAAPPMTFAQMMAAMADKIQH